MHYLKLRSRTKYIGVSLFYMLKAHNHLFWPNFKYFNLYYKQNIYIPIYFFSFWRYQPFSILATFEGSYGAVILYGQQNNHTSCVYFDIMFSGITPVYPNVTLKLGYVPLRCYILKRTKFIHLIYCLL